MPYIPYGVAVPRPMNGPKFTVGYGNGIVTTPYVKPKPAHVIHQVIPPRPTFVLGPPPPAKPKHGHVPHANPKDLSKSADIIMIKPTEPEVIVVEKPKPKPEVIIVEKTKEEPKPETKTVTIKGTENEETTTQCSTADGLIIAGSVLTGLSIAFAFAAFIVPKVALIVSAPFFALGLTLLGIGIYLKTREKKKGPLGSVKEARNNSVNNNINVNINQSQSQVQNQRQEEK